MPRKKYDRGFPYDIEEVIREELISTGKQQAMTLAVTRRNHTSR